MCYNDNCKKVVPRPRFKKGMIPMALVTTKEMFQKAYHGGYAVGAFNVIIPWLVSFISRIA